MQSFEKPVLLSPASWWIPAHQCQHNVSCKYNWLVSCNIQFLRNLILTSGQAPNFGARIPRLAMKTLLVHSFIFQTNNHPLPWSQQEYPLALDVTLLHSWHTIWWVWGGQGFGQLFHFWNQFLLFSLVILLQPLVYLGSDRWYNLVTRMKWKSIFFSSYSTNSSINDESRKIMSPSLPFDPLK